MILVGNSRGNYADAARHFMNGEDNEKVTVYEIRGFMGSDLFSAFQESYAVSLGTKAKQHLYSLSLSPPKGEEVCDAEFEAAIDGAEKRLGLTDQPRTIVFHEKRGRDGELRKHAHAIWCRVDAENGRAIHLSYDRSKLFELSHELFLEYGWDLPAGYENRKDRSPLNYTHAEHQQARRRHKYADDIKRIIQNAYERSDALSTFANALKEEGYILALGGHAAFVAVDASGEVYSIARSLPVNTKEIRARLGEPDHLPNVEQATELAAKLAPSKGHSQEDTCQKNSKSEQASEVENPIAKRIKRDPQHLLSLLTDKESVFTRHTIAKVLNSYIHNPDEYQAAYQKIISSDKLVKLTPEADHSNIKARYSTHEMVELERKLMDGAKTMANGSFQSVPNRRIEKAIHSTDQKLKQDIGVTLSQEQCEAIRHITRDNQLSCVVGAAGAGKSTILAAAREAWEANGQRVFGAALAGKAAKGLEQSSGIQSRTLASLVLSWDNGVNQLQKGDVLVIDEAGMIGSRQLAKFINEAKDKGAKLVLIGDPEQLQPINGGAPFKAITEQVQPATLHEVHRQKEDWQKQASKDFALGNTKNALDAYVQNNRLDVAETREDAIAALAGDFLNDFWASNKAISQLALAHRKADVRAINQTIRQARKEAGELQNGHAYRTEHGRREFAAGDRLLFTRNDREVEVKNGMLGTIISTEKNQFTVELDDKENGQTQTRTISIQDYADIEYGYATTIHKSQGTTVDNSYVLASSSMDRHLTYVAMTRHGQEATLYTDREEFSDYRTIETALSRRRQKQSTLFFKTKPDRIDRLIHRFNQQDAAHPMQKTYEVDHQLLNS